MSIDASTGILSGTPTESGTFPYTVTVTDADENVAHIDCEFVIDPIPEIEITATIGYIESSPRVIFSSPPDIYEATRYLYILNATDNKLYRTFLQIYSGVPSDWPVWAEETIPANAEPWLRVSTDEVNGIAILLSTNLKVATKALCNTTDDPPPQIDQPWTAYDLPEAVNPNSPATAASPTGPFYPPWWTISSALPSTLLTVSGKSLAAISSLVDPYPSPNPCTIFAYFPATNTLPAGTWNRIKGADSNDDTDLLDNVMAVGVGTTFARWFDDFSDGAWVSKPCPDGDWRDVAFAPSPYMWVSVGVGANQIMSTQDNFGDEFIAITAPVGATAVAPCIAFTDNMYTVDYQGFFISPGWTVGGLAAVVLIPVNNDDTLATPILATLPSLPANTKLTAIAKATATDGVIIVGTSGTDLIILTNVEGEDSQNSWVLKTIAEAPF